MIYEDETSLLRKGLFEVQNAVGLGRHEEMYHKAMTLWLAKEGIPHVSKSPPPVLFMGETAHTLFSDLVAWDKITIERKAKPRHLQDPERNQIFNYLKRRTDNLGLLVNMGLERVHVERIIYNEPTHTLIENWKYWDGIISGQEKQTGLQTRELLLNLYKEHTIGYGAEIIGKLISVGLQKQSIAYISSPTGLSI